MNGWPHRLPCDSPLVPNHGTQLTFREGASETGRQTGGGDSASIVVIQAFTHSLFFCTVWMASPTPLLDDFTSWLPDSLATGRQTDRQTDRSSGETADRGTD